MTIKTCMQCRKKFIPKAVGKKRVNKWCSRTCSGIGRKNESIKRHPETITPCLFCGKTFYESISRRKSNEKGRKGAKFCSRECWGKHCSLPRQGCLETDGYISARGALKKYKRM